MGDACVMDGPVNATRLLDDASTGTRTLLRWCTRGAAAPVGPLARGMTIRACALPRRYYIYSWSSINLTHLSATSFAATITPTQATLKRHVTHHIYYKLYTSFR